MPMTGGEVVPSLIRGLPTALVVGDFVFPRLVLKAGFKWQLPLSTHAVQDWPLCLLQEASVSGNRR